MRSMRPSACLLALLALSTAPVTAQAPDCTGVSDVSDFDGATVSELDGLLTTVRVAFGLVRPLFAVGAPGDTERLFIIEQDGRIRILRNGTLQAPAFLDVNALVRSPSDLGGGDEEGLLGLAFHPDYNNPGADNEGNFFVFYTNSAGSANVVARYTRLDSDQADPASRVEVISVPHTFASNHNGGMIAFEPDDGRLYIAMGDGGSFCDPFDNGQNINTNLGALLRLDVDSLPYSTTGNPFDGAIPGNDEIWSYGLRNPWRFSFDRITSAIYIADVGQGQWEEVDCRRASSPGGENYGWDEHEGNHCGPNPSCSNEGACIPGAIGPALEYDHAQLGFSCSITGGYVYRGCRMSDLHGTYFYADYCSNFIRSFRTSDPGCTVGTEVVRTADLAPGGGLSIIDITSFGEDTQGELYIVDRNGEVFKILPTLSIMEASGQSAVPLSADADFTWEDLQDASAHPISSYKVYRSTSPTGPFTCEAQLPTNNWVGGDPGNPLPGQVYHYLVTALNLGGEETRPGNRSDGTPRVVDTLSVCP